MKKKLLLGFGCLASFALLGCGQTQVASTQPVGTLVAEAATDDAQEHQERPRLDVPYVPTPEPVVREMLALARVQPNEKVYDLGCGDGRIVITAAKDFGARGVGVDIDPQRIRESKANAQEAGVSDRVEFYVKDLFEMDFRDADVVALYLLPSINVKLRPKLLEELRPGTRVVSHAFDMGDWEPDQTRTARSTRDHTIYYWVVPAQVDGQWRWQMQGGRGVEDFTLQLNQTYQRVGGELRAGSERLQVEDGRLDGARITLVFLRDGQRNTLRGEVGDNEIRGTLEVPGQQPRAWTARRGS
jgi:SAM-dependent methyltransferase